jgi:hypothetical protein
LFCVFEQREQQRGGMGPVQLLTGLIRGHNTTPREADMPDEGTVYALARRPDMDALRLAVSQPDVDLSGCDNTACWRYTMQLVQGTLKPFR